MGLFSGVIGWQFKWHPGVSALGRCVVCRTKDVRKHGLNAGARSSLRFSFVELAQNATQLPAQIFHHEIDQHRAGEAPAEHGGSLLSKCAKFSFPGLINKGALGHGAFASRGKNQCRRESAVRSCCLRMASLSACSSAARRRRASASVIGGSSLRRRLPVYAAAFWIQGGADHRRDEP